jgi:hypothetical protein
MMQNSARNADGEIEADLLLAGVSGTGWDVSAATAGTPARTGRSSGRSSGSHCGREAVPSRAHPCARPVAVDRSRQLQHTHCPHVRLGSSIIAPGEANLL